MIVKICAVALLGVCAYVLLSHLKSDISFAVKIALTVLIGASALLLIAPFPEKIAELASIGEQNAEYVSILLKAVGIAILAQITAEICRDCGEGAAASGVELAAKLEISALCLPLIDTIISSALKILEL